MKHTLSKSERISRRSEIERLFRTGEAFLVYPLKCTWCLREETPGGNRILVMVPKRNVKRAVGRNRIKRLLREAYRLHKDSLPSRGLDIGFSYIAKPGESGAVLPDYRTIETAVVKILERLASWKPQSEPSQ